MENWISAITAVLSLLFAVWSGWSSASSRKARKAAEASADQALRQTEAAEASAAELRKLVEGLQLPPLVVADAGTRVVWIRNTAQNPLEILELLTQPDFGKLAMELTPPFTLPPGAQFQMMVMVAFGEMRPSNLHFRLRDHSGERELHVPLPDGS